MAIVSRLISDVALAIVTIFQEAEGESLDGKTAVAEVILRRTNDKYSSDGTIASTCLRPFQFSGWSTGSTNRIRSVMIDDDNPVVKDCQTAWDRAVAGSNVSQGAVLYLNKTIVSTLPTWANPDHYILSIGHHDFYSA